MDAHPQATQEAVGRLFGTVDDHAEPDDAGTQQARLNLDGADHAAGAVEEVEGEGAAPSDGRLAPVGPEVLLYEGSERGLAHAVFPVHTGIDKHVNIGGRFPCMCEAGSGGGIGEAHSSLGGISATGPLHAFGVPHI